MSRLALQESHKWKSLQKVQEGYQSAGFVLFCFTLYQGSSNSTVSSRAGSTSLEFLNDW